MVVEGERGGVETVTRGRKRGNKLEKSRKKIDKKRSVKGEVVEKWSKSDWHYLVNCA